jgi:hypothetical protein
MEFHKISSQSGDHKIKSSHHKVNVQHASLVRRTNTALVTFPITLESKVLSLF